MNILAIDTSQNYTSLALKTVQGTWINHNLAPQKQAQDAFEDINKLTGQANILLKNLNLLCFGHGPGSFTGIRIACSLVQAFGFSLNCPVIGVSCLEAIALDAFVKGQHKKVLAYVDARMDEFYWGLYEWKSNAMILANQERCSGPLQTIIETHSEYFPYQGQVFANRILELGLIQYHKQPKCVLNLALPHYIRNLVTHSSQNK